MKISLMAICGESDHPLINQFYNHWIGYVDSLTIQFGVTRLWHAVNGNTSKFPIIFDEKVDQQNEGLLSVPVDTDYLFTFDVDEFVDYQSLDSIVSRLESEHPDVCNIQMSQFWKHDNFVAYGGDGWGYDAWNPRIFRYVPGMTFVNHRPPTPSYMVRKTINLPERGYHYSYVWEEQVRRKLLYYNKIYPQFDYMKWFNEVYLPWTPSNREQIEAVHSVHPSVKNAKTRLFYGSHFIQW